MSNNKPDYKDNLAFEKDMDWEEFVEYFESKGQLGEYGFIIEVAEANFKIEKYKKVYIEVNYGYDYGSGWVLFGTFNSLNAIKKVIEAIMEGVE